MNQSALRWSSGPTWRRLILPWLSRSGNRKPDLSDSLAALSKFLRIKQRSGTFYQCHFRTLYKIEAFLGILSRLSPDLASILGPTEEPLLDTAQAVGAV